MQNQGQAGGLGSEFKPRPSVSIAYAAASCCPTLGTDQLFPQITHPSVHPSCKSSSSTFSVKFQQKRWTDKCYFTGSQYMIARYPWRTRLSGPEDTLYVSVFFLSIYCPHLKNVSSNNLAYPVQ